MYTIDVEREVILVTINLLVESFLLLFWRRQGRWEFCVYKLE